MGKIKNNKKRNVFSLAASFVAFSLIVFYAWQVVDLMNQKYQMRYTESEIKKLKTENQHLKIEVAQLQSVSRVQGFALGLGMSQVPSIVYLPVHASEVAVKK
ncbi:MAG: septum formation initiator family protein [bacterium]